MATFLSKKYFKNRAYFEFRLQDFLWDLCWLFKFKWKLKYFEKRIKEILSFKESIKDLTQELDWVSIIKSICDLKTSVKLIKLEQELHQQKLMSISTQSLFDSKSQIKFQTNPQNSAKKGRIFDFAMEKR